MTCPTEEQLLRCAEEKGGDVHLDQCSNCRATVLELQETIGRLRDALPDVGAPTGERLLRLVPPPAPAHGARRLFVAAAAILLAATAFALYHAKGKPKPDPAARPEAKNPPEPIKTPARKQDDPAQAEMIAGGLAWLATQQKADGSFGDTALTGLSLLAFFGAGHGESSVLYSPSIRSALSYVIAAQGKDGNFMASQEIRSMYGDAIVTWALVDAVGGGRSSDPRVKLAAERGISYLIAAQNPGKGWRYTPKCGDNDTSVTFWVASALASARRAGFTVPPEVLDGARAWIQSVTDPQSLQVGYWALRTGKVFVPGVNEAYDHHQTMSAAGMAVRLAIGDARDDAMAAAVGVLATDPPSTKRDTDVDYYYWHIGSLALFLHEGAESLTWAEWQARLIEGLKVKRSADGSWEPNDRWGGAVTAHRPIYATALNVLTLETAARVAARK